MYKTIRFIIFSFAVLFITSCEKDNITSEQQNDFITENRIILLVEGVYNNIELDEYYLLMYTEYNLEQLETYRVVYSFDGVDTVNYNVIEFEIFSQDLNSKMSFEILYNSTSYEINYYHDLLKNIDSSQVLNIQGQNSFIIPMGTNNEVEPELLPKKYTIQNFTVNPGVGTISFNFNIRYNNETDIDYKIDGEVNLIIH